MSNEIQYPILTEKQIQAIKSEIDTQLLKRGFFAKTTLTLAENRGSQSLKLSSETFQTTPVIFKEIQINDFGSWLNSDSVTNERGTFNFVKVAVTVHVNYSHFGGGSNGCELFRFFCEVEIGKSPTDWSLHKIQIIG